METILLKESVLVSVHPNPHIQYMPVCLPVNNHRLRNPALHNLHGLNSAVAACLPGKPTSAQVCLSSPTKDPTPGSLIQLTLVQGFRPFIRTFPHTHIWTHTQRLYKHRHISGCVCLLYKAPKWQACWGQHSHCLVGWRSALVTVAWSLMLLIGMPHRFGWLADGMLPSQNW